MKQLVVVLFLINCSICFAQRFTAVNVFISNPHVQRIECIKYQVYNMDYVRYHHATHIFSMDEKFINELYDSLNNQQYSVISNDSVGNYFSYAWKGSAREFFEPCIVIDFIRGHKFNTNESIQTFAMDRRGYVFMDFDGSCNLYYPNESYSNLLKRFFPSLFNLSYLY